MLRVNWKRIVVVWGVAVLAFVMLSLGYTVGRMTTLPPSFATDITVVNRELSFDMQRFSHIWKSDITLTDSPSYYSVGVSLPFAMSITSVDASGEVAVKVTLTVNGILVFMSDGEIQVEPDSQLGLQGDFALSRNLDSKMKNGLVSGLNEIAATVDLVFPSGSGAVGFRVGPMTVTADPLDLSGDGLPEVSQLVKMVNYYTFTGIFTAMALVTVSVSDPFLQSCLDRRK